MVTDDDCLWNVLEMTPNVIKSICEIINFIFFLFLLLFFLFNHTTLKFVVVMWYDMKLIYIFEVERHENFLKSTKSDIHNNKKKVELIIFFVAVMLWCIISVDKWNHVVFYVTDTKFVFMTHQHDKRKELKLPPQNVVVFFWVEYDCCMTDRPAKIYFTGIWWGWVILCR